MKRTPLRHRSKKRTVAQAAYVRFVRVLLAEHPFCELGATIACVDPSYQDCRGRADGLHHLKKRSQGGQLIDRDNVRRACNPCNGWVEDHPEMAHAAGLVKRRDEA